MADEVLRNEATEEAKRIWEEIDSAAAGAPQWLVERLLERAKVAENLAVSREERISEDER